MKQKSGQGASEADVKSLVSFHDLLEQGKCIMNLQDLNTGNIVAVSSSETGFQPLPDMPSIFENENIEFFLSEPELWQVQALEAAVRANDEEKITGLIESEQIDPNVVYSYDQGSTFVSMAIRFGNVEALRALIKKGASVNVTSSDNTLLGAAISYPFVDTGSRLKTFKLLMDSGADIGARDIEGNTVLHSAVAACFKDAAETVGELLGAGAESMSRNCYGRTPALVVMNDISDQIGALAKNKHDFSQGGQAHDMFFVEFACDALDALMLHGNPDALDVADFSGKNAVDILDGINESFSKIKLKNSPLTARIEKVVERLETACRNGALTQVMQRGMGL